MLLNILKFTIQIFLPTRRPLNKYLKSIASNYNNLDILEIGSGDITQNQSAQHLFPNANSFIQTDINKTYGHKYLDITTKCKTKEKFDLILCCNVLEHVFDTKSAIQNLNYLLKEKAHLLVSVPFIYPLHDEPEDFWRFTEYSLKELFSDFSILTIIRTGLHQFPSQYIFLLQKD